VVKSLAMLCGQCDYGRSASGAHSERLACMMTTYPAHQWRAFETAAKEQ
jgi:hypothetical protein